MTIFIETGRFDQGPSYSKSLTHEFVYPTDSTQELLQYVLEDVGRIFRAGYRYRRAGVMFNGLVPASELTGRLFDNETMERFRRVIVTLPEISTMQN
jgi:DNA polymerase V